MNLCRNALPVEEGACTRRPGTILSGPTRSGLPGVIWDFDFAENQPYSLEFTPGYLRFRSGASIVTQGPDLVTATSGSSTSMTVTTSSASGFNVGDQVVFTLLGEPVGLFGNIARLFGRQFQITSVTDSTDFVVVDSLTGVFDATRITLGSNRIQVSKIVEFVTPYTAADLPGIRIVQTDAAVYILSVNHPTQLVSLVAAPTATSFATFSFAKAVFNDGPYLDPPTDGSYLTPNQTTSPVTLTGTNAIPATPAIAFQASDVGRLIRLFSEPGAWALGTTYAAGATVKFANAYWSSLVANNTGHQPDLDATHWAVDTSAAAWTWGTITGVTSSTVCTVALAAADPAGVNAGGPLLTTNKIYSFQMGVYSPTTGYPSCGTFHEGRVWFGTSALGNRFDSSMSNAPTQFAPTALDGTVADNNGISEVLEAADVSTVFWMEPDHTGIVMGTQSGEWLVQASQLSDPLTPTSIQAHRVSRYGSENIPPVHPPFSIVFVRRFATKLTELIADTFSSRYVGRNLSETASHFCAPGIKKVAYQQETTPVVWALMNDGTLCGMTYRRDSPWGTQPPTFSGWHKHHLGTGRTILDIAVGPSVGGTKDTLTLLTQDPATGWCFVELMTDIFLETDVIQNAWFLDGAVNPGGADIINNNTIRFYGLDYFIGKTITVWGAGLDLGDYLVPPTGQIDVPFTANPLLTNAYLVGLQGSPFNYETTLVPSGANSPAYVISAEENFDPATLATGFSESIYCTDQEYPGYGYDRLQRSILYGLGFGVTTPTNTTGYKLWSGQTAVAIGASYDGTSLGNHYTLAAPVDLDTPVVRYPTYSPTAVIASGLGSNKSVATGTITTAGSGYVSATYTMVPLTGGSGSYAFATVVVTAGAVTAVTVVISYGYAVNDVLTTANTNLGGSGSGFTYTVNTVAAVSDGTWRRITEFAVGSPYYGVNGNLFVSQPNGDLWQHALSNGTIPCLVYVLRKADNYVQTISPMFPFNGANMHMDLRGATQNYAYTLQYLNASGDNNTYLVGTPLATLPAETAVDYKLPYFWFTNPVSEKQLLAASSRYFIATCVSTNNKLYQFTCVLAGSRSYALYRFDEPSSSAPYNTATTGGGFTTITPWDATHGPNANASNYTTNNADGYRGYLYYLPASNNLVCISTYYPGDKTSSPTQTDFFMDCTYVGTPDGTASFDYHHAFVTGFMDANWNTLVSSGNTAPTGAAYAVVDVQEINPYFNATAYTYADGEMDYTTRWFAFNTIKTTQGSTVTPPADVATPDNALYFTVFAAYKFVSGSAPTLVAFYPETGWDTQLPLNTDYGGLTGNAVAEVIDNPNTRARIEGNGSFWTSGVFDETTNAFWWGGQSLNMWSISSNFSGRENHSNNNPTPPFLRLAFSHPSYLVAPFSLGATYETDCQIVRALDPREAGAANGPALGKTRRTHQVGVLFNGAQGVSIGTDFTHMRAISFKLSQMSVTTAPLNVLYSDVYWETLDDDNSFDSEFAWKITRPYPATVVAVEQFLHSQDR